MQSQKIGKELEAEVYFLLWWVDKEHDAAHVIL